MVLRPREDWWNLLACIELSQCRVGWVVPNLSLLLFLNASVCWICYVLHLSLTSHLAKCFFHWPQCFREVGVVLKRLLALKQTQQKCERKHRYTAAVLPKYLASQSVWCMFASYEFRLYSAVSTFIARLMMIQGWQLTLEPPVYHCVKGKSRASWKEAAY